MDHVLPRATSLATHTWRDAGYCRDKDPNLFFPLGRGRASIDQVEVAKAYCRTCPSREPCLAYALDSAQLLGVWGGTSPEERRVLLGRARRARVAS
jgi:WhiB family transcriptional regulator, redox-sensing transcriptional regulator